jgi:hypothetical protein
MPGSRLFRRYVSNPDCRMLWQFTAKRGDDGAELAAAEKAFLGN